jgi:hypothetical protein
MAYIEAYEDLALDRQQVTSGEETAAFNRMGDGINYSPSIGWQSPEGNFYGQKRVVREFEFFVVWDGLNYWPCNVPAGYAGSFSDLPESVDSFGDFWAVPNGTDFNSVDTSRGGYWSGPWDIYYWDTLSQTWNKVQWLWTVLHHRAVPYPGKKIGCGHKVIFYNVTMMWDGYRWVKAHRHSGLDNDEPEIHMPEGFIQDYEDQISDTHGRISTVSQDLLSHASANEQAFDGIDSQLATLEGNISDIDSTLTTMDTAITNLSSGNYLTLAEANTLDVAYDQLSSESETFISWAESLNITTEKINYSQALATLGVVLSLWTNNPPYPKEISEAQRDAISDAIKDVELKKVILSKKIDELTLGEVQLALNSRISEAVVEFRSKTNIGIFGSIKGSVGAIWCSGELLFTDLSDDVTNAFPVLNYNNNTNTITAIHIEPSTNYFIYIANYKSAAFNVGALPADGDKPATSARDFRGNLFLSQTEDFNGTLGTSEPGLNARIVGKCATDDTAYASGGPYFIREINMSLIGRSFDLSQAFTEYSDYRVEFVDQDTLAFNKFDGTIGLCYVAGQLLSFGNGLELSRSDYRVNWTSGTSPLSLDTSGIASNQLYNIYLSNSSDEFNLNATNPGTGFPYQEGEVGYLSAKDMRHRMFLSTKEHDHRLLDESYPGYYARHIGQIETDDGGYFRYSSGISLIRSATLNPTHLDGLAECSFSIESATQFKVFKKTGTTGIVYVGGKPVQTYERDDSDNVHTVNTNDTVYTYTEADIESPLSSSGTTISTKVGVPVYLYLANDEDCWGSLAEKVFLSMAEPENGYLSRSWPGNNARWLATIETVPSNMGSEKVTNGDFTLSSSWTFGSGWTYDSVNFYVTHGTGTESLSQTVSVSSGMIIQVIIGVDAVTQGSVHVRCGGVESSQYSIAGNHSLFLSCINDDDLEIIPSSDFNGNIDDVSVRQALTGNFLGSIFKETVLGLETVIINDNVLSTTSTWSSIKIQQELNNILSKIGAAEGYSNQKQFGLPLRLEYYDSTRVRLYSTITGSVTKIVFPDMSTREIPSGGVFLYASGSTTTLYYVYLYDTGNLVMSTSAPDIWYDRLAARGTSVLVGYVGCSATNTFAGNWNVFSLYGEPTRTWTSNITTFNDPYIDLPGIVVPPNRQAVSSRTGNSWMIGAWRCNDWNPNYWGQLRDGYSYGDRTSVWKQEIDSEYDQGPDPDGYYYAGFGAGWRIIRNINNPYYEFYGNPEWVSTPSFSSHVVFNYPTLTSGVHEGHIVLDHTLDAWNTWSSHGGYNHTVTTPLQWEGADGQIVITRQSSVW